MKIDLSQFQKDHTFYGELNLLLTVKSFDLQAIRKRYLASKKNNRAGSVKRRKVALGGLVSVTLKNGMAIEEKVLSTLKEPRGIDYRNGQLAVSSENKAYVLTDAIHTIQNDWFSYIHTVEFSPFNDAQLLISSSGYDCVFEYDWQKNACEWEWFAWENGMCVGKDPKTESPLYLTRDKVQFSVWEKEGKNALLIDNPLTQVLPTAKRAAFINSVSYHQQEKGLLLATFFHLGSIAQIEQKTGVISMVMDELKNPHGGWQSDELLMATSTASGEVRLNEDAFLFQNLADKPTELGEMEWLQNSKKINDFIVTIDSNRTSFVVFHPEKKLYDTIPYNDNWAVQDMVEGKISKKQLALLRLLSLSNE